MTFTRPIQEICVVTSCRVRDTGCLDHIWVDGTSDPTPAAVALAISQSPAAPRTLLGGGEPTLRADLLDLIQAATNASPAGLTLASDGLALHKAPTTSALKSAGLEGVQVPFHTGRADAYDWLVGIPGASRRVRESIKTCLDAGLAVAAEVILTRPTMPHLEETVGLLIRDGVRHIRFRMLRSVAGSEPHYITLAPRVGLLEPYLDAAIQRALQHAVRVEILGLPECAIPRFADHRIAQDALHLALPEGIENRFEPEIPKGGCPGCPGHPRCAGAPADYVRRFGWTEFDSQGGSQTLSAPIASTERPRSGDVVLPPPGRHGRSPSTRVMQAAQNAELPNMGGDPLAGRALHSQPPDIIAIQFAPGESTRQVRHRLVQAAQQGIATLRIVGPSLDHEHAFDLLRETLRLSFQHVEIAADPRGLAGRTNTELFQLRGLSHLYIPLHGPDASTHDAHVGQSGAYDAALAVGTALANAASVPVSAYGVLQHPDDKAGFEHAWQEGHLPGRSRFSAAHSSTHRTEVLESCGIVEITPQLWGPPGAAAIASPEDAPWFVPANQQPSRVD